MLTTHGNLEKRNAIFALEKRIEDMHGEFHKFRHGQLGRVPNWERLERDLISFSAKKIQDLELAKHLDRVLYKFQNRKRIWLRWIEEVHRG